MRVLKIAAVSFGLALASPGLAVAQEGFAAGAIMGALTGGLAGGSIGAAIGGLAGAAIGGAAEANHARWQAVRPVAEVGRVGQAYPRQRTPEAYPHRRTVPTSNYRQAVPMQASKVQRQQLASAVAVMERTCVRDRAGNQTCREIIR